MIEMGLYLERLSALVGREHEQDVIRRAVEGVGSPIVFVEGIAGIGKTTLLEAAERNAAEANVMWPPLMDFYDVAMHSNQGLEAVIADSLDPQREQFANYWRFREHDPQRDLWDQFLAGYSRLAQNARIVLRFDTAERLEYERDPEPVRHDCEVQEYEAPSWNWLLRRAGSLPNTAVLIAARPTSTGHLRQRLSSHYGDKVTSLDLAGLRFDATVAYVCATEIGRQLYEEAPEVIERIHRLAEGRPILISLTLDWLSRGDWDRRTLEEIADSDFERALVEQIRRLATPLDKAVRHAALCRKGCNADLLARLMSLGPEEAQNLVQQMQTLSFVKPPRRSRDDMFFLHDEMYDLVGEHVWMAEWPGYEQQERLDAIIIEWYDNQIERLSQAIPSYSEWRKRSQLRRKQQLLYTERLYYQLDRDPKAGYREYVHLAEQVIGARDLEWDSWLRNELFAFIAQRAKRWQRTEAQQTSKMEHDARRMWINRFVAREHYDRAIGVAQKLLARERRAEEPALYRGGLHIALATAQAYKGGPLLEDAIRNFDEGIQVVKPHLGDELGRWLPQYLMGTAYLYKGLALRGTHPLAEAQQAYARAIYHFRSIDYRPGLAEALNNLAFVMARQGGLRQARAACEEALAIRQVLGDEYAIGLSLNTKGIIEDRLDRPVTAINHSLQALRIFTNIGSERGMILAAINLGRSYRRKGRSPDWGQQDADFEEGEKHLLTAIERQKVQGANADTYYRIQAHNELGCLYRDWVATLYNKDPNDQRIAAYLEKARDNLNDALQLARGSNRDDPLDTPQYVDSLEDLARVYYWWARVDSADKARWLQEMAPLLTEAESLASAQTKRLDELQLVLGKISFQRARQAQEFGNLSEAARNFALATGYVERYSSDAPELLKFALEASNWLARLEPPEAKRHIKTIREALASQQLPGRRLQEWIDAVVQPLLGIGWDEEEVIDG